MTRSAVRALIDWLGETVTTIGNSQPRVFVSQSFGAGSDDLFAHGLRKSLGANGLSVTSKEDITQDIETVRVWEEDIIDLWESYRKAGLNPSWQEQSDPRLGKRLVESIASHDIFVGLWSIDYANKYWCRVEWKTALALAKPIVLINLDGHPLASEFERGVQRGLMTCIQFGPQYHIKDVIAALSRTLEHFSNAQSHFKGETIDTNTGLKFIQVDHPLFGEYEISEKLLTAETVNQAISNQNLSKYLERADTNGNLNVSWEQACELCQLLSSDDCSYRIPTDAEWEFAARSGDNSVAGTSLQRNGKDAQDSVLIAKSDWGVEFPLPPITSYSSYYEWCLEEVRLWDYDGWVNPVQPEFADDQRIPSRSLRSFDYFAVRESFIGKTSHFKQTGRYGGVRLVKRGNLEPPISQELSFSPTSGAVYSPKVREGAVRDLFARSPDHDAYHKELEKMREAGKLTSEFRQHMEECIEGSRKSSLSIGVIQSILQDVKDTTFVPPLMPDYLRDAYDSLITNIETKLLDDGSESTRETRIASANAIIETLNESGLLSRAFMEILRHGLWANVVPTVGEAISHPIWKYGVDLLKDPTLIDGDWTWT